MKELAGGTAEEANQGGGIGTSASQGGYPKQKLLKILVGTGCNPARRGKDGSTPGSNYSADD
jgi:hypothetical protein